MSIYGIGTDLVNVERIARAMEKRGFSERVFTPAEIAYCSARRHSYEHFAARFAAKEAFMKAIGSGWSETADFREIEVVAGNNGAPELVLHGKTRENFVQNKLRPARVSLSHTSTHALAFVIIES